jgi:hypothetical protein
MIFTKNEKIFLYIIFILLIIIFIYRINKNENEYMTVTDNNSVTFDKIIFYKLLKKSFNLQDIPNQINMDLIKDTSPEIILKSNDLNNYLFFYDYVLYLYRFDSNSFIIDETIVKNVNGEIKILDMSLINFPYPFVSIDDDDVLEFKNLTTGEIKKVRMTNTTNEIKNKDVVILINSIRTSMENYLNILAKEFKNINLYNLDSNTEIYAQQYTTLHGLILQSKNMMNYLFADNSGLYKVSIVADNENNNYDIKLNIIQIRIKNSAQIIFTPNGNLLSYNNTDKLLYVFVKECNKNVTKLVLSDTGKIIFTDKTNNIYNSLDLEELKDSILKDSMNKNLLMNDSEIFNQKVNEIFNSVNNITFTYNPNILPKRTKDINNDETNIKPYIRVPPIHEITTITNNIKHSDDISGLHNIKPKTKTVRFNDTPTIMKSDETIKSNKQTQKPQNLQIEKIQQAQNNINNVLNNNWLVPYEYNPPSPSSNWPYNIVPNSTGIIDDIRKLVAGSFDQNTFSKNAVAFKNTSPFDMSKITFSYNITPPGIGLWIYVIDDNGIVLTQTYTLFNSNNLFAYPYFIKPSQSIVFDMRQMITYQAVSQIEMLSYDIMVTNLDILIPYAYNMNDKKLENQLVLQNNTFTKILDVVCFVNNSQNTLSSFVFTNKNINNPTINIIDKYGNLKPSNLKPSNLQIDQYFNPPQYIVYTEVLQDEGIVFDMSNMSKISNVSITMDSIGIKKKYI